MLYMLEFCGNRKKYYPREKHNWSNNEQVEKKGYVPSSACFSVLLIQEKSALYSDTDRSTVCFSYVKASQDYEQRAEANLGC